MIHERIESCLRRGGEQYYLNISGVALGRIVNTSGGLMSHIPAKLDPMLYSVQLILKMHFLDIPAPPTIRAQIFLGILYPESLCRKAFDF